MLKLNSINFNNYSFGARSKKQQQTAPAMNNAASETKSVCAFHPVMMQQFMLKTKPYNPNTLSIFYYNDTHGNSDQMADVVNNANKFKSKAKNSNDATFILSAGDNCSGGDYKKNEFIFNLMQNIMGVEASAVGNHEVDAAGEGFYEAAKDKNVTFIATNVEFDDDNKMKDVVKKSIIKEKNGVKYGFVGTMPIDFKMCTKEDVQKGVNVMDFDHTVNALQNEINNLKAQGVNRIILLSHIGYDADKRLVSQLDGVDIVIGGHTHNVVKGAQLGENVLKSKSGEPVIITQGGENGLYYGILNVEFDDNGVLKKVDNNLVETTNRAKNPVIEYVKNQDLGESPHIGTIQYSEPLPPNRRIEPCGWTEIMADSMKHELGGDIALINSANIRKVPRQGNLTQRDVMESAPMRNRLVKAKITQKQLVEAVKNAAHNTMTASDGYPGL
ncbi:5'-nucleotidase C-terminal domain-containing protein, partial [bacterium]|nr:5'-nucleotidase C-terminal domain-containing protein [bacterium]